MTIQREQDGRLYELVSHLIQISESREDTNRRHHNRRKFPAFQFVAPYDGRNKPLPELFQRFCCHDLSEKGFSYSAPVPAVGRDVVVGLGTADDVTYLTAHVVHTRPVTVDGQSMFLIGCQFDGKLEA